MTLIQTASRTLFAAVPERGPVSVLFAVGGASAIHQALAAIKPALIELRPDRSSFSIMFALTDAAREETVATLDAFSEALTTAGFLPAGVLAGSPQAQDVADGLDLMVADGAAGCTYAHLEAARVEAEQTARKLQEAADWDEALGFDTEFNRQQEAKAWDEALAENVEVDARLEAARLERARQLAEEAHAWEEALAEDAAVELKRADALAWDAAIAEDLFRAALKQREAEVRKAEEARAWDQALAHQALLDRAAEAAEAARQAVMAAGVDAGEIGIATPTGQGFMATPAPQSVRFDHPRVDVPSVPVPSAPAAGLQQDFDIEADVAVATDVQVEVKPAVEAATRTLVHKARVRSGSTVYAEGGDLMMFGTLSSGAEAMADGNVSVMGPVHGRVMAGVSGDTSAHIVCQAFFGELISIGGIYIHFENMPSNLRGAPVHFYVEDQRIHFHRLDAPDRS